MGWFDNLFGSGMTYSLNGGTPTTTVPTGLQNFSFGNWVPNADGTTASILGPTLPGSTSTKSLSSFAGQTGYDAAGNSLKLGTSSGGLIGGLGALGNLAGLAQAGAGLWNAFNGMKALEMARDQFGFQKRLANRNLANQAKIINNTYDNAAQVAAGMIGGKDSSGNYGFTDQALVNRYASRAKDKHVDGSAI